MWENLQIFQFRCLAPVSVERVKKRKHRLAERSKFVGMCFCTTKESIVAHSLFITLKKHARSIMLSNWERGGSAQPAEQRQCKQLCQCKHSSQIICEWNVRQAFAHTSLPSHQMSQTVPASRVSLTFFWHKCIILCFRPPNIPLKLITAALPRVSTNALRGRLSDSMVFSLEVAGCSRRTSVDTADLCYSKRNIWPCLFSEIDPTLCFKFIFIYHGKYVSADPLCTLCTDSSPRYATGPAWLHGLHIWSSLFKCRTVN